MTAPADRLQRRPATTPCYLGGDLWDEHVDRQETRAERRARHDEARRICATCPVKASCLRQRTTEGGIWGGELFREVQPEPRRRPEKPVTTRPADGRCHCGEPIPLGRNPRAVTCGEPCERVHDARVRRTRRDRRIAEQVDHVLHGGTPDGISRPAREQLIDHWTAAGRSAEWIAPRVGWSARNVQRRQVRHQPDRLEAA